MRIWKSLFHQWSDTPRVTPAIAAEMKTMVATLGMKQQDVAAYFGVNQARVSEVVNGHKFGNVPPADKSSLSCLN